MLGSGQLEIIFGHVLVLSLNSRFVVDGSQVWEALLLEPRLEIVWAFTETNGEAADELESQGVKHAILVLKFVLDPLIVFQLKAVLIQHFLCEPGILLVQGTALPLKIWYVLKGSSHVVKLFQRRVILEKWEVAMINVLILAVEMLGSQFHFDLLGQLMESLAGFEELSFVMSLHIGDETEANGGHLFH